MSHLTVAASEDAVQELFNQVRDGFTFSASESTDLGSFTAGYAVSFHLENGSVELRADGTIRVAELDVVWDVLNAFIGVDLPEKYIGGFCIFRTTFGCALRAPKIWVFSANPDIDLSLNLSGLLRSELSLVGGIRIAYFVDPGRLPGMTDLDAQDAEVPNKWQLFLDPESVDIDVFDFADIVGDLLEDALDAAIDLMFGWLPGWAQDLIRVIFGPIIDLVRLLLDIPDDIEEWLSDLLGISLGLADLILTVVGDYFATEKPIDLFDDPLQILSASAGLIPVKIPVRDLAVRIDDVEMVLEANVGA
jgi:hypothetical protein